MRHSAAHLIAAAVKKLYPRARLGIGPIIENGFYYDFDLPHKLNSDDFSAIENEVENLKGQNIPFEKIEKTITEAIKIAKILHEPYKVELIRDLKKQGEKKVSFYKTGDFIDLCTGPHVKHSGLVGKIKLLSVAGAYWRGSEKNKMLQRIYGTAWPSEKELASYLERLEEAKKRDHKKIGAQLGLFTFLPVAPGMPFWYPKGFSLIHQLKDFIRKINSKYGYQEISTPLLAKKDVWETSGHWKLFKKDMFTLTLDKQTYALKPMNCPETLLLYNTTLHSYRDLPIKFSDLDMVHRYEESGTLHGLFRVRELSQDDAHAICTPDQVSSVIEEMVDMASEIYKVFGFTPKFYLATRPDKALGDLKIWKKAEADLEKILRKKKLVYELKEKEGSFYGPKIDLHIDDALGRDWQLTTIQLDYETPKRFASVYTDQNGKNQTPAVIHRAILGSFERFVGILIENYGGSFPTWLAPIQIKIIPIAERHISYANELGQQFINDGLRAEINVRNETMQAKIRDAQVQKIPYMLVVGDKEKVQRKVSIRSREKGDEGIASISSFVIRIKQEIDDLK